VDYILVHQWVRNYKPHGITGGYLKYRDVDVALRTKLRHEWNRPNYPLVAAFFGGLIVLGAILASFRRGMMRRIDG
jgi:hypothetical protein